MAREDKQNHKSCQTYAWKPPTSASPIDKYVFVWMKINCLVKPTKEKLCSEIMGMMEGLGFMTTAALKAKP